MSILGAHQSIAGGYHKAVATAERLGCDCLQLFTHNTNQWRFRVITQAEAERFRAAVATAKMQHVLAHDSYLINLASPDNTLWQRSVDAFVEELRRAAILGIPWVVAHPGAHKESGEEAGLARVVAGLDEAFRQTADLPTGCLLETTAGQGTSLGWRFEHLATILDGSKHARRLGVCFDTCHVFAAGYRFDTKAHYEKTINQFDQLVGVNRIRAFHLNDSRGPLGCRVDRHAHIGRGQIGLPAFRRLLADPRFRQVPMYLETPKGEEAGDDLDTINLRVLRGLVR